MLERNTHADLLPFWVVSMYLSVPEQDLEPALEWAGRVPSLALRQRLTAYLRLRLRDWNRAAEASRLGVEADPDDLVAHQLLATSLIGQASDVTGSPNAPSELLDSCRRAIEIDPANGQSRYLVRAAWEVLGRAKSTGVSVRSMRDELHAIARTSGIELSPAHRGSARWIEDDFTADGDIRDGRPLRWRVIEECCPGEIAASAGGLCVTREEPGRRHDAWLVTEEAFSGDVTVETVADVGTASVSVNIHVDLGSASLYYGKVFLDGRSELGRLDYGRRTALATGDVDEVNGDMHLELRSRGDRVELRVWPDGAVRPESPTAELRDSTYRVGCVALSTWSRPACFRRFRVSRESE